MAEIRSAIEIAMEKADRLGRAGKEEIEAEKWLDHGRRVVSKYMQGEKEDLKASLDDISGTALPFVLKGAVEVLVRNIVLPRDKGQWSIIKKAFRGLAEIKGSVVNQIIPQIEQLLENYERTRDHYHEQLRVQMQSRLGGVQQAVAQQYGESLASAIDVESLPEFQQEWSRVSSELTEQFVQQLVQSKAILAQL